MKRMHGKAHAMQMSPKSVGIKAPMVFIAHPFKILDIFPWSTLLPLLKVYSFLINALTFLAAT